MAKIRILLFFIGIMLLAVSCEEEDDSAIDFRAEYVGVWQVQETDGINSPQFYTVNISEGIGPNDLVIDGLYNLSGNELNAVVDGFFIIIPRQVSLGITFEGTGTAITDFSRITVNFTADDGSGIDQVRALLTP